MRDSNILINRYALSLYSLAKEESTAEDIYENILKLADSISLLEGHGRLALSKQVPKSIKSKIWHEILETIKVPDLLKSFIMLLLENGRIDLLTKIIAKFHELLLADQGIKPVHICTSFKLSTAEYKDLEKRIERVYGQKVELEAYVDESLIGGMTLRIDSFMLDASIKTKLNKIKQTLLA